MKRLIPLRPGLRGLCLTAAVTASPVPAEEIELRVRRDEIATVGETTIELSSYAQRSSYRVRQTGLSTGAVPTLSRALVEVSHGVGKGVEFGLRLPAEHAAGAMPGADAAGRLMGLVTEVKYVAAPGDLGLYWGVEGEVGRIRTFDSASRWQAELLGIVGWRHGPWHLAANPTWSRRLGQGGIQPGLNLRLTRAMGFKREVGLEAYLERREVEGPPAAVGAVGATSTGRGRTLGLLTLERPLAGSRLGLAIGRAWGTPSASMVVRIQWDFDDD